MGKHTMAWTPLMHAAFLGDIHAATALDVDDVDVETNAGWTALYVAAAHGHLPFVEYLASKGGSIHHCNLGKTSVLMNAAGFRQLDMCLWLLDRGADYEARNVLGMTAADMYGFFQGGESSVPECTAMLDAWRKGPHPTQVQRRRDEAWERRRILPLAMLRGEPACRPLRSVLNVQGVVEHICQWV